MLAPAGGDRAGPQPVFVEDGRCGRRIAATIGGTRRECAESFVRGAGWRVRPGQRSTWLSFWRSGRRLGPRNRTGASARRAPVSSRGRRCRGRPDSSDSIPSDDCTDGGQPTRGDAGAGTEAACSEARRPIRASGTEAELPRKSDDEEAPRLRGGSSKSTVNAFNEEPKAKVVPEREILLKAPLSDERDDGPIRSPVGARAMESCADGTMRVHSDSERRWARKLGTDLDMNSCGAL